MNGIEFHPAVVVVGSIGWILFGIWIGYKVTAYLSVKMFETILKNESLKNVWMRGYIAEQMRNRLEDLGTEYYNQFMDKFVESVDVKSDDMRDTADDAIDELRMDDFSLWNAFKSWRKTRKDDDRSE